MTLRARLAPRVGGKFVLTVGVAVPAVLAVAVVGALGLRTLDARSDELYSGSLPVTQHAEHVVRAASAVHETALYQVAVHDPQRDQQLGDELDQLLLPELREAVAVLRADYPVGSPQRADVDRLTAGVHDYEQIRATGAYEDRRDGADGETARTDLANRTDGVWGGIVDVAQALGNAENRHMAQIKGESNDAYASTLRLLQVSVAVVLLLVLGVVLALIRNMVPRIKRYSQFAADVAAGRPVELLNPRGQDELADLGRTLDDMLLQRQVVARSDRTQAEFADTLQVTRSEDEAQELLQRHVERSLARSSVVVLRSNNSANRLQAVTRLPADGELAARLARAEPRSCVAVRLGRTHREGPDLTPLLACTLCVAGDRASSCEPLLVGGEVIGSVVVTRPDPIDESDEARIRTTVAQAAPVLANLRSLALAEFRANNDSLTGLPNKRATEDSLKRMVAQANRSESPLTADMLDLDHFKAINDRFGHAQGDEVLAAVGAAIRAALRSGDLAGRFGGEEFLVLLPETCAADGWEVAERIRRTIAGITVPGVEREITASLGVAELRQHGGNASGLMQEADKAQYAAKAAGRNRCVVAVSPEGDQRPEDQRPEDQQPEGQRPADGVGERAPVEAPTRSG